MSKGLKYLAYRGDLCQQIILFSPMDEHYSVAQRLNIDKDDILGAGFVDIAGRKDRLTCYGRSISLGVVSRGDEDTKLLHRYLSYEDDEDA